MQKSKTNNFLKAVILICILLYAGKLFGTALTKGMNVTVRGFIILPIALSIPLFVRRYGLVTLLSVGIICFWIPTTIGLKSYLPFLSSFYLLEIVAWSLAGYIIFRAVVIKKDEDIKKTFARFPFILFILLPIGAIIAHYISHGHHQELLKIRRVFFFPGLITFVCMYVIKNEIQGEKLLWQFLYSAGILGLIVLFGQRFLGMGALLEEQAHTLRLSYSVNLPLFGNLSMHAAAVGNFFSIFLIFSFNFWMNHPVKTKRLVSGCLMLIFSLVVLKAQTRGGFVAAGVSMVLIMLLSRYSKESKFTFSFLKTSVLLVSMVAIFWYSAASSTDRMYAEHGLELFANPLEAVNFVSRVLAWEAAIPLVMSTFFGVGLFGFHYIPDGNAAGVHNMPLFFYLSSGFLGFISFVLIHFHFIKNYIKSLKLSTNSTESMLAIGGIGLLADWWIAGMASPMAFDNWSFAIAWIAAAIMMSVANIRIMKHETGEFTK